MSRAAQHQASSNRAPAAAGDQAQRSAAAPSATAGQLLALQRHAGNRAVARLVSPASAARRLARYSGHEHESLGNVTGASVDLGGGVVLSWGQVLALAGDEFGSVVELREAAQSDAGRREIRAALERAGVKGPIPATLPQPSKDERAAHTKRYHLLALENVSHYAPGEAAIEAWRTHHRQAMSQAAQAGMAGDDALFNDAMLTEAFGQHFLTDVFSGGHVRTPRKEIIDFHAAKAQAMASAFIASLRSRLEGGLTSEIMLQLGPGVWNANMAKRVREQVSEKVRALLDAKLAAAGGMDEVARIFGLLIAGAISGVLHDKDGEEGVVVASEDHPQPWTAYGDGLLDKTPVSRQQAEQAVLASRQQVITARGMGERETKIDKAVPADPPQTVHFAFDSAELDGAGDAIAAAGAYLHVNPGTQVEIVGHTDQLGDEGYNLDLGWRRVDAVEQALVEAGAKPEQIVTRSEGRASPITSDPLRYGENRRVEFHFATLTPGSADTGDRPDQGVSVDPVRERAELQLDKLGPPYAAVERYVPKPVEDLNEPIPEWRWGQMSPQVVLELNAYARHVAPEFEEMISDIPKELDEPGPFGRSLLLHPQRVARNVMSELMADPAGTMGKLVGEHPAGTP